MQKSSQDSYRLRLGFEIIVISILWCGCRTIQFEKTDADQPKALCYSLNNKTTKAFEFSPFLDLQSVYINEMAVAATYENRKVEKFTGYEYLQFGFDQIAFASRRSKEKITTALIALRAGQYCYYNVKEEKILLEFYDFHLKKFIIWEGRIYPDKIHFYKGRVRGFTGGKEKLNLVYHKRHIENLQKLIWPS